MAAAKPNLGDWFKGKPGATTPASAAKGSSAAATTEKPESEGFYVPASEIDSDWELGKWLVRIVEAEDYTAEKSGNKSFKLRLLGLHGAMKGAGIDDYWPKAGKGLKKTQKGCKAVGLTDEHRNIHVPGGASQFVGRELWIEIEEQTEKYRNNDGEERTRTVNKIGFLSYWPKDAFELPKDGDLFAEEGQPLPAKTNGASTPPETITVETDQGQVTAIAATGEVVGVEAGAAPPNF